MASAGRKIVVDKQEEREAAGVSRCRAPQPALLLLTSAPKSLLSASVSSCHLFPLGQCLYLFPRGGELSSSPTPTSKIRCRRKGEQSLTEMPNWKAWRFLKLLGLYKNLLETGRSKWLSALRYQSRCDRAENPLPCQSICWRFDNKVPLYNVGKGPE